MPKAQRSQAKERLSKFYGKKAAMSVRHGLPASFNVYTFSNEPGFIELWSGDFPAVCPFNSAEQRCSSQCPFFSLKANYDSLTWEAGKHMAELKLLCRGVTIEVSLAAVPKEKT